MILQGQNLIVFYIAFLFFAVVLSAAFNQMLIHFSKTLGVKNHDVTIVRWSTTSKPALGGISFFLVFLLSAITYMLISDYEGQKFWNNIPFLGLLASTGIAFFMGLSDDAYNTKPMLKFFVQIFCGLVLIGTGTYIQLFESQAANYILTLFWVVGLMNSINMLDNMDGITTIVSVFIILEVLMLIYLKNQIYNLDTIILIGIAGALIGFLFHNWYPSKMFMGDTGSQFLGVFLAAIGIKYFWNFDGTDTLSTNFYLKISLPLLAFALPIIDTTTVTINRIMRGQPPYVGGKDHTTHALSYLGLKDNQVGWVFLGLSLLCFLVISFSIAFVEKWTWIHALAVFTFFVSLFGIMFYFTKVRKVDVQVKKSYILAQSQSKSQSKVVG